MILNGKKWVVLLVWILGSIGSSAKAYEVNDAHFHITNYVQEGTEIRKFLEFMGDKVGRVALFGIPLQQTWDHDNSGNNAPTYYLHSDAPLYYYSFTDAVTAATFNSLSKEEQARFDPMITGFNPADMYGADHIRRVLKTFPGVFEGIGEFTIHKEFVSAKTAGGPASLVDPAIDRILKFAGETGLLVLMHSDIDAPFAKPGAEPVYLNQMKTLLKRHRNAKIIWAHMGLGRVVHPVKSSPSDDVQRQVAIVKSILDDGSLKHVFFDISWDEVAKYILVSPEATKRMADLINRYPDRFLFGSDVVAPTSQKQYLEVYETYAPLWSLLTPEASEKVRKKNYERLFDEARRKVRAWEKAHLK